MRDHWRKINNAKASELWSQKVDQLFEGIEFCLGKNLWEPTLILLYAGIDAMAWLDRSPAAKDVTSQDFIAWCQKYLLAPGDDLLTADDLYAARCGLLHSHTGESSKHREGKVKKVFYSRRTPAGEINFDQLSMAEHVWPVWVDLDVIVQRFRDGVAKFRKEISEDAECAAKVYDRVNHSYLVEIDVPSRTELPAEESE